jgi:hypothetical protein
MFYLNIHKRIAHRIFFITNKKTSTKCAGKGRGKNYYETVGKALTVAVALYTPAP